jgi:beta-1,4-N-acetylglucosaminyltransferase
MDMADKGQRLLVLLGEGGHSKEILILVSALGPGYAYHYVVTDKDPLSESKIEYAGPVYRVCRPRGKNEGILRASGKVVRCALQALRILRHSRADALLTSGPALAVPFALWARLLGVRVIFVETGSRVHGLSLTGRLMRPLAHLFFVQWPELHARYPWTIYAGRLC